MKISSSSVLNFTTIYKFIHFGQEIVQKIIITMTDDNVSVVYSY